jgi:hypothetical protein
MPKKIGNLDARFLNGAARRADLAYASVTHEEFLRKETPHSYFLAYYNGQWMDCGSTDWKCAGMTIVNSPTERMLAISEDGEVYTYVASTTTEERITPAPAALRGVTTIDGKALAFGMRRQAYLRTDEGVWSAMHGPELSGGEAAGFEAACGPHTSEIYAVGWRGQIWQYDGSKWIPRDSPTNVILTGCTLHDDDSIYICGQDGTIIRGRSDSWTVLRQEEFSEDCWAIHSFGSKVYVATLTSLYELADDKVIPVSAANVIAATFHTLTSAEGILWSIGEEDAIFFDGSTWKRAI